MEIESRVSMLQEANVRLSGKGRKIWQVAGALTVSLGTLCAGTCLAWTSPALAALSLAHKTENSTESFYLSHQEDALVGSMITVGALISAIPTGFLTHKFGPKIIILSVSLCFILNWLLIIFSQNSTTLIIGRFFGGLGTGAICVAGAIYIHEISEHSSKGILASFINLSICTGIFITGVVGAVTTWRILSVVLSIFPVIFGAVFFFMPESPVYLIKKDNLLKAKLSLACLRGENYDIDTEVKTIKKHIELTQANSSSFLDICKSRPNRRAFVAVVGVLAFQQLCGLNAIVFYTVSIFKAAGSTIPADYTGVLITGVQLIATFISLFVIEKANRKFYLLFSSVGMFLFMTALAMYFHLQKLNVDVSHLGFIPIGAAVLFMVSFSFGFGPVPWLLMGELYTPQIKAVGNGIGMATNWSCAFLVAYFFPIINNSVGAHVAFYICSGIMAVATIYVIFLVPETRGKTPMEIQIELNK